MTNRNVPDAPDRAPPPATASDPSPKHKSPKPDLMAHFLESSKRYEQQSSSACSYPQNGSRGSSLFSNTTTSAPCRELAPYESQAFFESRQQTFQKSHKRWSRSSSADHHVMHRFSAMSTNDFQMPYQFSVGGARQDFKGRGSSRKSAGYADERYYDGLPEIFATTVIVHNVNAQYKQNALVHAFSQNGFEGAFDFLYVPVDVDVHGRNLDIAIINFIAPSYARGFCKYFEGFYFSGQSLRCTFSDTQGFHANVRNILNLPTPPKVLPLLFCPDTGAELPFPKAPRSFDPSYTQSQSHMTYSSDSFQKLDTDRFAVVRDFGTGGNVLDADYAKPQYSINLARCAPEYPTARQGPNESSGLIMCEHGGLLQNDFEYSGERRASSLGDLSLFY